MNNVKVELEEDFVKSTRKIATEVVLENGRRLNLFIGKRNEIKASIDDQLVPRTYKKVKGQKKTKKMTK